jgi:hypothetical protein
MREFFKGWRRKVGCVTLMMSLVLMAGWIRSTYCEDVLMLTNWPRRTAVDSLSGSLYWSTWEDPQERLRHSPIIHWDRIDALRVREPVTAEMIQEAVSNSVTNFKRDVVSPKVINISIPYWSITIPLTLLTAYLILWKPRKRLQSAKNER